MHRFLNSNVQRRLEIKLPGALYVAWVGPQWRAARTTEAKAAISVELHLTQGSASMVVATEYG
jgi:hypothetical protein